MSLDALFAISRFGLNFQRLRMEAAAHNLAISNTVQTDGISAQPIRVSASMAPGQQNFAAVLGQETENAEIPTVSVAEEPVASRTVHDPSSPLADKQGNVHYPNVDPATQMTTLVDAERAYQADVRAFNTLHNMILKALQIGGRNA